MLLSILFTDRQAREGGIGTQDSKSIPKDHRRGKSKQEFAYWTSPVTLVT